MDRDVFNHLEKFADDVFEEFTAADRSGALAKIKDLLQKYSASIGEPYSLTIDLNVKITSDETQNTIPVLRSGYSCFPEKEPFIAFGDSTAEKYWVSGHLKIVPHDYCPNCWAEWDFKSENTSCPACESEMGREIKFFVDGDICPHCDEGKFTRHDLQCSDCSFSVPENWVAWG